MAGAHKYLPANEQELNMHRWFSSEEGCELFDSEKEFVRSFLDRKLAFHLVQLDCGSYKPLFAPKHAGCGSLLSLNANKAKCPTILADAHQLPFLPGSVDVIVAYHYLDFCIDPRHVLRQIDISLTDSGSIVVVGFNPWSPFKWLSKQSAYQGRRLSLSKLADWLKVLGYEVEEQRYIKQPFFTHLSWWAPWRWLANTLFAHVSGLNRSYVVVARKQSFAKIHKKQQRIKQAALIGAAVGRSRL